MNFFDEVAGTWQKTSRCDEAKVASLLAVLQLKPGETVLDVGTGTGVMLPFIRERVGAHVPIVAVDSSEKMLREALVCCDDADVHFVKADVELERLAGRFDAILLYSVFPHFRYPVGTIFKLVTDNLHCDGRLLIAHAQGRQHLNAVHRRLSSRVFSRPLLPVVEQVEEFVRVGLTVQSFGESDESYYILVRRGGCCAGRSSQ